MDKIKVEPDSHEEYSLAAHSEGNSICIKEEYIPEELFSSQDPENTHFKSILQCKKEAKQEDKEEKEQIRAEEHEIIINRTNLLSDKSDTAVDRVGDRSEDEDSQPSPWRVCGSDALTVTEDSGHILNGKEDSYCCEVCNKQFRWLQSFQRHLKAHSIFWCEECNREFCSRLNLQLPTETEALSSYACEVCHIQFTRPGHLRQHVAQWHWRQKPYSCNRCAEGSSTCDKFTQMAQQCPVCKHNFASYDYLRAHLKHHSKDKVYLCNTCNMQCFTLTVFKNHLETHKEEKRIAPKMYKRKSKPLKGLLIRNY